MLQLPLLLERFSWCLTQPLSSLQQFLTHLKVVAVFSLNLVFFILNKPESHETLNYPTTVGQMASEVLLVRYLVYLAYFRLWRNLVSRN